MKTNKLILAAFAALTLASCEKPDNTPVFPETKLAVLTFEDKDWTADPYMLPYCNKEVKTWSDLIDSKEYNGTLLYNDKMTAEDSYCWYDKGNTELRQQTGIQYWSGGHAVSNYIVRKLDESVSFEKQLSLYVPDEKITAAGHNGSKNFCIHTGYSSSYGDNSQLLEFGDGQARVIDHMWVNNTAYALNILKNGNPYCPAYTEQDYLKVTATGYNGEKETGMVEFFLAKDKKFVEDWTKWELSGLGKVTKVRFDMKGFEQGKEQLNAPAYFAYDDVAVVMK